MKYYSTNFIASICVHLLLLILFCSTALHYETSPIEKKLGQPNTPIKSYVYQYRSNIDKLNRREKKGTKKLKKRPVLLKKTDTVIIQKNNKFKIQHPKKTTETYGKENPLLQSLHNAIAKAQHYPEIAYRFHQHGNAKVRFSLYPNGQINNISIVKSSGYPLLNNAAIETIKAIIPVEIAGKYLERPKYFVVEIVY